MENDEYGLFVKKILTKKVNKETKEEIIEIKYVLRTHSICALELALLIKGQTAYDPKISTWYKFSGTHWAEIDNDDAEADFYLIFREETEAPGDLGHQASFFDGVIRLLRVDRDIFVPKIQSNYINFLNGVLDVEKAGKRGDIVPATYQNSQKWCIPYEYQPGAWPRYFLSWLSDVFGGDKEKIQFIQAFMNCIVKRRSDLQFYVHFKGNPRAGKGTLTRFIENLISKEDRVVTDLSVLSSDKFEALRLYGKALVMMHEQAAFTDLKFLMKLTGRDQITARQKNVSGGRDFTCEAQFLMIGNDNIIIPKNDVDPLSHRMRTVLFDNTFSVERQAKWLKDGGESRLMQDASGVINWILSLSDEEVTDIIMNPPLSIRKANREAEVSGNGLTGWLVDYLIYAPGSKTYIGKGDRNLRNGKERFGGDPEEDESGVNAKLLPAYLSYCSSSMIKNHLRKNDFTSSLISTANRIFGSTDIGKAKRDSKGQAIENIRFKTDFEFRNS